jgi:hypothetical protein
MPRRCERRPGVHKVSRVRHAVAINATHINEARVESPSVNNRPLNLLLSLNFGCTPRPIDHLPQLVQAGSSRTARVLGVLRERDGPLDSVPLHLRHAVLRQRLGVSERDVRLVRGSLWGELVEELGHALALRAGPLENWRTSSDGGVLSLNLGRTALGDQWRKEGLEREGDEVSVVKQPREEVARLSDLQKESTFVSDASSTGCIVRHKSLTQCAAE